MLEVSGEGELVENDGERVGREFDRKLERRKEVRRAHEPLLIRGWEG